ncbi:hypothetical protein FCV76_18375 [Vibrio sp. F13]|nr:hypothetical protein FCV76_18375 [Vibrio sp. F13]
MFDRDKILKLNETYTFDVSVRDERKLFAGKLTLSPSKCTLRVMGERRPSYEFSQSTKIECSSFDKSFLLFELTTHYQSSQTLQSTADEHVGFFEYEFEVGFVICTDSRFNSFETAVSFSIDADMNKKWVGYTKHQKRLVDKFHTRKLNPLSVDALEFTQELEGYGCLNLFYDCEIHGHSDNFTSGMNFPPKLKVKFDTPILMENLHFEYKKFYDLMTLLIGSDFKVDIVEVVGERNKFSSNVSAYFPVTQKTYERDYPVFPLSHNQMFHSLPIPEFPLDAFNKYYRLPEDERITFTRYLRYRRVRSEEERFLGYFRLLESLVYKSKSYVEPDALTELLGNSEASIIEKLKGKGSAKDIRKLISRIGRLNKSKYNTSKCLIDYYAKLPSELKQSIDFDNQGIEKVCKLRNDITHANAYSVDEKTLHKYISFVNMLLCVALFEKIGVHPELSSMVVHRLDGFHHIQDYSY